MTGKGTTCTYMYVHVHVHVRVDVPKFNDGCFRNILSILHVRVHVHVRMCLYMYIHVHVHVRIYIVCKLGIRSSSKELYVANEFSNNL